MRYLFLFYMLLHININAQNIGDYCVTDYNGVNDFNEYFKSNKYNDLGQKGNCNLKEIRLVFHFMLKEDGTGNFSPDGVGGTEITGYKFAFELLKRLNKSQYENKKMNLPPENNLPVLEKNFFYTLEQVLFHEDDIAYFYNGSWSPHISQYLVEESNVINVFFQQNELFDDAISDYSSCDEDESDIYCCNNSGAANKVIFDESGAFITTIQDQYCFYKRFPNELETQSYNWLWDNGFVQLLAHEIGHLLGLNHTVRANGSCPCPSSSNPYSIATTTNCVTQHSGQPYIDELSTQLPECYDDGIDDTPSVEDMFEIYNSPVHPACGEWSENINDVWKFCSNNLMDYNKNRHLSPKQIEAIHTGLSMHPVGTKRIRVCTQLNQNNTFCEFEGYPQISYYGDKIKIAPCPQEMIVEEEAIVHYNEEVEFSSGFEVLGSEPRNDNLVFEVRQHCKCRL